MEKGRGGNAYFKWPGQVEKSAGIQLTGEKLRVMRSKCDTAQTKLIAMVFMDIKILAASLMLTGCSTTVKVHVPMQCLPMPEHHVAFTEREVESVMDSVLTKFELITEAYKARIRANIKSCELHNQLHEVKE